MSAENPYAAPGANVDHDESSDAERGLASRGKRFGAAMIDGLIGLAVTVPLWFIFNVFSYKGAVPYGMKLGFMAYGIIVFLVINSYFLKQNGQTVGKKLVGIRIADLDGGVPAFGRLIGLRVLPVHLVTAIPFIGTFLPLVDCLFIFREDRRCIHDLIAGTKVVNA